MAEMVQIGTASMGGAIAIAFGTSEADRVLESKAVSGKRELSGKGG
jgi:hypothetical protein